VVAAKRGTHVVNSHSNASTVFTIETNAHRAGYCTMVLDTDRSSDHLLDRRPRLQSTGEKQLFWQAFQRRRCARCRRWLFEGWVVGTYHGDPGTACIEGDLYEMRRSRCKNISLRIKGVR
jgi:hypothetical protein